MHTRRHWAKKINIRLVCRFHLVISTKLHNQASCIMYLCQPCRVFLSLGNSAHDVRPVSLSASPRRLFHRQVVCQGPALAQHDVISSVRRQQGPNLSVSSTICCKTSKDTMVSLQFWGVEVCIWLQSFVSTLRGPQVEWHEGGYQCRYLLTGRF